MGRLVACVFALGVSVGSAAAAQTAVANGEKVFMDQKCTVCHSIAGTGNVKGPLDEVGSRLSADEIRVWMTDAKGMTAKPAWRGSLR